MKVIIDIIIVVALFLIGIFLYTQYWGTISQRFWNNDDMATIYINQAVFSVQVAADDASRIEGLSGQKSLPQYGGMLFIFDKPAKQGFWMKDMNFPIDILWFDESFHLVHIEQNVSPSSYPTIFAPRTEAQYVVELNANMTDRANIALGDTLTIPPELIPRKR